MAQHQIAAFYHFGPIPSERLNPLSAKIEKLGRAMGLRGLIILAFEGINGTISGPDRDAVTEFLVEVAAIIEFPVFTPKWSEADFPPFRKFKVRLRKEIVTLGKPEVQPLPPKSPTHLSPAEWDRCLREEDVVLLDTRNTYETRIGKFKGAIDPKIEEFQEFGRFVEESGLPKEKKILIYCTGGIRCEKAIVEMETRGFQNVYQLDGGILNYLAQRPRASFEGECFVFDNRVAVDQDLAPTAQYKLCPHCGQPADQPIDCVRCDSKAVVCVICLNGDAGRTCTKNCAHHNRLAPGRKGRNQSYGRVSARRKARPSDQSKSSSTE